MNGRPAGFVRVHVGAYSHECCGSHDCLENSAMHKRKCQSAGQLTCEDPLIQMLEDCWKLKSRNWMLTCVGSALIIILQPVQPYGIKHLAFAVREQIEFFTKYR